METNAQKALLHNEDARTLSRCTTYSILAIPMSLSQSQQAVIDLLDDTGSEPGEIDELEKWWVDRQVALEQAGYMLRSRYRPGWRPSWAGTKTFYLDCEDGRSVGVSVTFLPPPTLAYDF